MDDTEKGAGSAAPDVKVAGPKLDARALAVREAGAAAIAATGQQPRFRLMQESVIDDVHYEAGSEAGIGPEHVPGPHWLPLNAAAKAMCDAAKIEFTGEVPDPLEKLQLDLAQAMATATGSITPEQIAKIAADSAAATVKMLLAAKSADGAIAGLEFGAHTLNEERILELVERAAIKPDLLTKMVVEAALAVMPKPEDLAALVVDAVKTAFAASQQSTADFVAGVQAVLDANGKKR